jgi:phosphoribosyl 1,2-cyclic phosphate phosphodiesterase
LAQSPKLRATILGCGSSPGVPRIGGDWGACDPEEPKNRRSRCAFLVERVGGEGRPTTVLFDTGPDVRAQLLVAGVTEVDGVVYTHAHADHLHGIDDLRAFHLNTGRLVDVYADAETASRIESGFGYCVRTPAGGAYAPILRLNHFDPDAPLTIDGPAGAIAFTPIRQIHGGSTSLGFRAGGFAYTCDVSDFPDASAALLEDLDVWVIGALRYRPHPSHLSVEEALGWIDRLKPRRAILTHMHNDLDYATLREALPAHVEPGYDGMQLSL